MKDFQVEEGYREWQKHALYEQSILKHQILQVALCEGIKNTADVRSFVLFNDLWGIELGRTPSPDPELCDLLRGEVGMCCMRGLLAL
jgi:hypothetical protein